MKCSIIFSSYNRLPLFRRTLWALASRHPSIDYEVVVCDDNSTDDILGELKKYSSVFPWKFIKFDSNEFEQKTGLKKFFNNPAVTNNIAFKHSTGDIIFHQGNEIIAWNNVYNKLIDDIPTGVKHWMIMSTTYDIPKQYLDLIDDYGANLYQRIVTECERWPLQSQFYRSDVTNYISLAPRETWEELNGYDERYFAGISADDSDFVRRARKLEGFKQVISEGISLHQWHGGKTKYYDPPPSTISKERWDEGVSINHKIYHSWDNTHKNPQTWPFGTIGVQEVISNV